jgi:serine/threonine protein kinase
MLPGSMSGTPTYASPEQIIGERIGQSSDVYSLGLILYELIAGRLPFSSNSSQSILLQRLLEEPLLLSEANPEVNLELEKIVMHMLARDPVVRYPNMDQVIAALSNLPDTKVKVMELPPTELDRPSSTKALSDHPIIHGPHLVVTGTGTVLSLPKQREVILGRTVPHTNTRPDVDLGPFGAAQAGVSRQHARLRYAAEGWLLEDLDSTNGTSLNTTTVKPGKLYRIHSGDVIRCGRLMLVFFER